MERSEIRCKSCQAEIIWRTTTTGKSMPLDILPSPERGNVKIGVVNGEVTAIVLGAEDAAAARSNGDVLYVSHFATCPGADAHRKSKSTPSESQSLELT